MDKKTNLIWIDTELTGLDFDKNKIVEISVVITDKDLNILDKGLNLVIHHNEEILKNMNPWCIENFEKSGLTKKSGESELTVKEAEKQILEYLKKWTEKGKNPICGNSVGQDRKTLYREMFELEEKWLSHRTVDVTSIKELVKRWKPEVLEKVWKIKKDNHRAMDDILESIEELKIYKKEFFDK